MTRAARAEGIPHARVVLDAMGGDDAPETIVAGALLAVADGIDLVLVGDEAKVRPLLEAAGVVLPVVHAPEAIGMAEDPALALRTRPRASIRVAAAEVAQGHGGALVSAGSTGATLAAALLGIGRLTGVRRPAVAAPLPGGAIVIDAGASSDVQPDALPAYAAMGVAYARVRGVPDPRVGLLNVGAEAGKGNSFAKAAHAALTGDPAFAGNVEPAAVLAGAVDVVVTDGFTGNIFLKTLEAAGGVHDSTPGAAVLLGCARPVLVAHGDASAEDIAAALRTAHQMVAGDLIAALTRCLPPVGSTPEPAQ